MIQVNSQENNLKAVRVMNTKEGKLDGLYEIAKTKYEKYH